MIIGTGIDIVEVKRIRESFEKFGAKFAERVLCPAELTYCLSHKTPATHLAARFAAKEAISKAFGTGIGHELGWQDMEIGRRESGEPHVILSEKGAALLKAKGAGRIHISLTHTHEYAAAVAILES